MQKTNNQTIVNKSVGADDPVRPKQNRGITLIALIITIIVMLILVAVTINVALDTGLFGTAKKGAYQTEVSTIKEQLEIVKVAKVAENGGEEPTNYGLTLDDLNISDELKNKYGSKLIISKDGTLYYNENSVTDQEKINLEGIGVNKYDADLEILRDYFLGENREGKNFMNLVVDSTINDPTSIEYKDDPGTLEDETELASNVHSLSLATLGYYQEIPYEFYIKYNDKAFALRVKQNDTTGEMLTTSVEYKYTRQGNEGQDLGVVTGEEKYKGWTILYDYGNGTVEAVSPTVSEEQLTLGAGDTTINWENETVKTEANIDGEEGLTDIEKAIYSYNHAIETINNYCKEQIADDIATDENVRSVGAKEDPRPNLEKYNTYNEILGESKISIYNGKIKLEDTGYEEDIIRMGYYGILNANNSRICCCF